MKQLRVLHVEDDPLMRKQIANLLRRQGCKVVAAASVADAWAAYRRGSFDLLLLDLCLVPTPLPPGPGPHRQDRGGLEFLRLVREAGGTTPAVLHSALASTTDVSAATALGIRLFLEKTADARELLLTLVDELAKVDVAEPEFDSALAAPEKSVAVPEISGASRAVCQVRASAVMSARAPEHLVVMLTGETGSGKDRLARAIHRLSPSPRCDAPFEAVNCTEVPAGLFESIMFGHEAGSFTGAHRRQVGAFERAADGTLLLDEIGEIPLSEQPKLLRVLETRHYRPLGAREPRRLGARLMAATNRDLQAMVAAGTFRADLYHRLNGIEIRLPSLSERAEDVDAIVRETALEVGGARRLSEGAIAALSRRHWPGNVREVRATVERLFAMTIAPIIDEQVLGPVLKPDGEGNVLERRIAAQVRASGGLAILARVRREVVRQVLAEHGGNGTRAAEILGVSRKQIARWATEEQPPGPERPAEGRRPASGAFRKEGGVPANDTDCVNG